MKPPSAVSRCLAAATLFAAASAALAEPLPPRLVVTYKADSVTPQTHESIRQRALSVGAREVRQGARTAVYELAAGTTAAQVQDTALRLAQDSRVLAVEPDVVVRAASAVLNDPGYPRQWALGSLAVGSSRFASAWTKGQGTGRVIAVLDTGIVPGHPELGSKLMPGFDFVSAPAYGGDGNGRDSDPTDPGDYCLSSPSSWHGTVVASAAASIAANGYGVAGAAPGAYVLPVRVMGRCGGYLSDVADAVRWAAGLSVYGAPANSSKADVINLSLGGDAACPLFMQAAIDDARRQGSVVVAAAGNDASDKLSTPANCVGALAVVAHTYEGKLASYSNRSEAAFISAPGGGNCRADSTCGGEQIVVSGAFGAQTFVAFKELHEAIGTSLATPFVSAAAAILRSIDPALSADQIASYLRSAARPHADTVHCASGLCGAGMLDAEAAAVLVVQAAQPTVAVRLSTDLRYLRVGESVELSAVAQSPKGAELTYQWSVQGASPSVLSSSNVPTVTFTAPDATASVKVSVTVQDTEGLSATADATIVVRNDQPLTVVAPATVELHAGERLRVQLSVNDPSGTFSRYVLLAPQDGPALSGSTLTWAAVPQGTHAIRVAALNIYGEQSEVATIAVVATNKSSAAGSGGAGAMGAAELVMLAVAALAGAGRRKKA